MKDALIGFEEKRWSFGYYSKEYKDGWQIWYEECLDALRRLSGGDSQQSSSGSANTNSSSLTEARNEQVGQQAETRKYEDGDECTSISHGIIQLSKMLNSINLYVPGFLLDVKPGLMASRRFAQSNYVFLFLCTLFGFWTNRILLEPVLINILPSSIRRVTSLLADVAIISQNLVVVFGLGSVIATIYLRHSLQDFVLYRCNIISLPRAYQRRKAFELFLTHYFLAIFSKPAFVSLMVILDPKQPQQLLSWPPAAFLIVRWLTISVVAIGSTLVCSSGMIIPMITSYLIACSATYLDKSLKKHMSRSSRSDAAVGLCSWQTFKARRNQELERLLDERTRRVINDYSCDTLTCDWPELMSASDREQDEEDEDQLNESPQLDTHFIRPQVKQSSDSMSKLSSFLSGIASHVSPSRAENEQIFTSSSSLPYQVEVVSLSDQSKNCLKSKLSQRFKKSVQGPSEFCATHKRNAIPPHAKSGAMSMGDRELIAQYSSASHSLLFIYKNLIKNLSELKGMISIYECRFGVFHILQICMDSLIVAQWVTSSLTEMRIKEELKNQRLANKTIAPFEDLSTLSNSDNERASALVWLSGVGVLSFVLSNTYLFMRCDCLPDCMVKMRSKLFKMNIDLARLAYESNQRRMSTDADWRREYSRLSKLTIDTANEDLIFQASRLGIQQIEDNRNGLRRRSPLKLVLTEESAELDQVWSLYDQIARMSELANFKLFVGTYYSKKCLLWIFGRTVSLTLLCIQIVDIYSYT